MATSLTDSDPQAYSTNEPSEYGGENQPSSAAGMLKYYIYQCAPSTESRGRRADHDKGCGKWNVRGTNVNLNTPAGRKGIQARPCPHCLPDGSTCGKRQRLSAKNTWEAPPELGWDLDGAGNPVYPNREKMKAWAYQEVAERNRMLSINRRNTQQNVSNPFDSLSTISEEVSTNSEEVSA